MKIAIHIKYDAESQNSTLSLIPKYEIRDRRGNSTANSGNSTANTGPRPETTECTDRGRGARAVRVDAGDAERKHLNGTPCRQRRNLET